MQSKGMIMHRHALVSSLMISSYQLGNETTTTYPSVDLIEIVELVQKVLVFGLQHGTNFLQHLLSGLLTRFAHIDDLQERFVLQMLLLRWLLDLLLLLMLLLIIISIQVLVEAVFDSAQQVLVLIKRLGFDLDREVVG